MSDDQPIMWVLPPRHSRWHVLIRDEGGRLTDQTRCGLMIVPETAKGPRRTDELGRLEMTCEVCNRIPTLAATDKS